MIGAMDLTHPAPEADAPVELSPDQQAVMVSALCAGWAASDGIAPQRIETHISFVVIHAGFAYKFKKVLKTSFLDQSTLALREHACHEELRLNRRLAPALYLDVVPITGRCDQPLVGGSGPVLDVAVKMRAFAQDDLWDRLAARGALSSAQVDELVAAIGAFHDAAAIAPAQGRLGTPDQVRAPLQDSLQELLAQWANPQVQADLQRLARWEAETFPRLAALMARRLAGGRVRECHGDLHLGNVASVEGRCTVFDGIEFNDDFRWLDVVSEIAFMAMDLQAHGLPALAQRWLNGYLEHSGDYEGVRLLNYYLVHRALVRAKVALMRDAQASATQAGQAANRHDQARRYLDLALQFSAPRQPLLMITHGYSGSGKTTMSQGLLEATGAIRVRADVERKRLLGLPRLARSHSPRNAGLYGKDKTEDTYARLLDTARAVLAGGWHVILDATFLNRTHRSAARDIAAASGSRFLILDFDAAPEVLRQRLRLRAQQGLDASEADEGVLAMQMQSAQALQADELAVTLRVPSLAAAEAGPAEPGATWQGDWASLLAKISTGFGTTPGGVVRNL